MKTFYQILGNTKFYRLLSDRYMKENVNPVLEMEPSA